MLAAAVFIAACALAPPQSAADRTRAEQLARSGHSAEAITLWQRIAAADPADVEARIWIGMLHVRLGAWRDALPILLAAERDAPDNADLLAALARAYRLAGDDDRALRYYRRAHARAPADGDITDGYENLARISGSFVAFEGFGQQVAPGSGTGSGRVVTRLRAAPRLHLLGQVRAQHGDGYADALAGGGVEWRAGTTTISARASGGHDNDALANADVSADVVHYTGPLEIGATLRALSFAAADVTAISPALAWDRGGRWRVDARYAYSSSRFGATGERRGDHSGMARGTIRPWRRVALNGAYAYGIESFEDLTADRLFSLGAHTGAAGTRITLRSLAVIDAAWEHQWRSNASTLDRVTISFSQFFP
jgi:tetratricopeptide (TPR) repeat protein